MHCVWICLAALVPVVTPGGPAATGPLPYTGVTMAGGEFYDPARVPDPIEGKNYIYPTAAQYEYFASRGMNTFRLAFLWETLQPRLMQPFVPEQLAALREAVQAGTRRGLVVILDPHNYARHLGKVVGGPEVPAAAFADFWRRLATEFRGDIRVWFGLVNEPHGLPTSQWLQAANAAIAAIRGAKARNLVLVPGNAYSGAHSWTATWYGEPNGTWMDRVVDPADNFAYEVHQYLDQDSSGTHAQVVSRTIGSERLSGFVQWCRERKRHAFLGEFAVPANDAGRDAVQDMLRSMERDRDVWLGFTWWAAGAWWGDYMFSLEPRDGQDRPQLAYLRPHLRGAPAPRLRLRR